MSKKEIVRELHAAKVPVGAAEIELAKAEATFPRLERHKETSGDAFDPFSDEFSDGQFGSLEDRPRRTKAEDLEFEDIRKAVRLGVGYQPMPTTGLDPAGALQGELPTADEHDRKAIRRKWLVYRSHDVAIKRVRKQLEEVQVRTAAAEAQQNSTTNTRIQAKAFIRIARAASKFATDRARRSSSPATSLLLQLIKCLGSRRDMSRLWRQHNEFFTLMRELLLHKDSMEELGGPCPLQLGSNKPWPTAEGEGLRSLAANVRQGTASRCLMEQLARLQAGLAE